MTTPPKNQVKKPGRKIPVPFLIFVAISLWFIFGYRPTPTETVRREITRTMLVDVQRFQAERITADVLIFGITEARGAVNLTTRTAGIVDRVYHPRGSFVRQGDTIFRLRMEDREARLQAQTAAVAQARFNFNNATQLYGDGLISRAEYIATEANYRAHTATLEQIRLDIEHTSIRAPFDGIVDTLSPVIGQFIASGTNVGRFFTLDPIRIRAEVPEAYITRVHTGSTATVTFTGGNTAQAKLRYAARAANQATRTFVVELYAPNPDYRLRAGMTARLRLPLDQVYATQISVSSNLTFGDDGTIGIKTIDDNNIVHFWPVNLVREEDGGLWVTGLPRNANVIVAGQEFVAPGERVNPNFIEG